MGKFKGDAQVAKQEAKDAKKEAKLEGKLRKAEEIKANEKRESAEKEEKREEKKMKKIETKEKQEEQKKTEVQKEVKKEETKLKVEKQKLKAEKQTATGSASGAPPSCPKCKKPQPCPKPAPQFSNMGSAHKKYSKMKEKYLKCKVDSSSAISNLESVKQVRDKFKKEKEICNTKLMESAQPKPQHEPGPVVSNR